MRIRPSREEAETVDSAVLLALLERELEAEADAERRPPAVNALAERVIQPARAQPVHRARRRPHPGQHGEIGLDDRSSDPS